MKIRHPHKQNGAFLVISAVVFIVLLGFAALALDLGRIFVQQSEMQNAADAAARSGAMELDANEDARSRAVTAARDLLRHRGHFSRNPELLEQLVYNPDDPTTSPIVFYSWIGSADDPPVHNPATYCAQELGGQWLADRARCLSTEDATARYMEIWLDPARAGNADAYTVDLLFLPVLEILGDEVARFATVSARAVAGRHFFVCDYPPVMFCNPFEQVSKSFARAVADGDFQVGQTVVVRSQRDQWAPGNFGFLRPRTNGGTESGASALGRYMADPTLQGCTTPWVHTQTGNIQSHPVWGWNTRFGDYRNSYSADDYPPAPVTLEYPRDEQYDEQGRFGNGTWNRDEYWSTYHSYYREGNQDARPKPDNWSEMTRWEVYNWEIGETGTDGLPPCAPDDAHGVPNWDSSDCPEWGVEEDKLPMDLRARAGSGPERRVLFTAIVDCQAQDIRGSDEGLANTFAKFFILDRGVQGAGNSDAEFTLEFMGLADEDDAEFRVEVQLYE